MSAKRQSLINEESYEALQALFVEICQYGYEEAEAEAIWRRVLDDLWYQAEVRIQAARVVGHTDLDKQWCDDLAQNIVVQLRAKLSNHCDLGGDPERLRTSFPGWLGNIIKNCCIDTLRCQGPSPHPPLTGSEHIDKTWDCDLRLDMIALATQLEYPQNMAVLLNLQGYNIEETAVVLGINPWQVQYAFAKAKAHLVKPLAPYADDIRPRQKKGGS